MNKAVNRGFKRPPEIIEGQVRDALKADGYVNASAIRVEVDSESGDVTLTGKVPSEEQLEEALKCAASVEGVGSVHNQLEIGADTETGGDGNREFGRDSDSARHPPRTIFPEPDRSD